MRRYYFFFICLITALAMTATATATTMSGLQSKGGWKGYGEKASQGWAICPAPCTGITWSMVQHIQSPALSGNSTKFSIGGTYPYGDVLWTNSLIGQMSTQGVKDYSHTLLPTLHYFTYDAYFYGTNLPLSQVLEFDVSEYMNGHKLIWGTQCRIAGGHQWDIWNASQKWIPTGIYCNPPSNKWNHLILKFAKTSGGNVLFQSITLNGVTHTLNKTYAPGSAPSSWWGLTINVQTDMNSQPSAYHVYVDKLNLTYQ